MYVVQEHKALKIPSFLSTQCSYSARIAPLMVKLSSSQSLSKSMMQEEIVFCNSEWIL